MLVSVAVRVGDIVFGVAAAFLLGVFAANMGWDLRPVFFIIAFLAMIALLFVPIVGKYAAALLVAVLIGAVYYHAYVFWVRARGDLPSGKDAAFFGVVTEEPKQAGNFTMVVVGSMRPYSGVVDLFMAPSAGANIRYGDELWVNGNVGATDGAEDPPAMFFPVARVVAEHQGFWLKEAVLDIKDAIAQKVAGALPADQGSLLAAIMLGTAGTMSATLKAQMEASGTSYITGMYGYKIAIISSAMAAALKDRVSRRSLLTVTLGVVAAFVFASGAGISAIRAAVMGSAALVARGTGRIFSARNALTFAALGMVLLNATLLTDAAFQLSFLSFAGISILRDPVNDLFGWKDKGAFQWKEHAMLSLTTNLAILPVVIGTFGSFSLASFASNVLIMLPWLAILSFGAILAVTGFVAPPLAFAVAQAVGVLLRYELLVIRVFAAIVIPMPAVFGSPFVIALYYGALIIFAHYYGTPSPQKTD
ncbi:MAG TPA: ComEC/Rec2 family competence protein [Candidatus Paceibacterota bacterium]|nr:ComEC/Rec2 family competence protein [Candidatus Paceibacterota bacterium]